MNASIRLFALPSLAMMVLSTASLTLATPLCAAADRCKPLKLQGTTTLLGDPFEGSEFVTEGTGTHLGKFTGEGFVEFGTPDDNGIVEGSGTQTFFAANGDELYTSFTGTLDLVSGLAVVDFVIEGGTGRFEGAGGEFTAFATLVGETVFEFTTEGEICVDVGKK